MITVDLGKTPQERENLILVSMICLGVGILSADVFIPLGFVIWILYDAAFNVGLAHPPLCPVFYRLGDHVLYPCGGPDIPHGPV